MSVLVSVIISTYNVYYQLKNTIESVLNQTHENIEIIIINDNSFQYEYQNLEKEYKNNNKIKIIDLKENNSRDKLGYPSCGYVRNFGFKIAKGEYIAIVDDDDYWLPDKLEKQLNILLKNNYIGCCTDAYISDIKPDNKYQNYIDTLQKYNSEYYNKALSKKYDYDLEKNFNEQIPDLITKKEIDNHNLIICSSIIFNRKVFDLIGYMPEVANWKGTNGVYQDWNYWKQTCNLNEKIYYLKKPLLIYYKKSL